jgi:hypothetical protein
MSLVTAEEGVQQALEQLGAGNLVGPAETAIVQAGVLADAFRSEAETGADSPLEAWGEPLEAFLAAALPTSVYGGSTGLRAVLTSLRMLAREATSAEAWPQGEPLKSLAFHHTVWLLAGYGLANERLDVLTSLATLQLDSPHTGSVPVFNAVSLRHAAIFDRGADKTFEDCRQWLLELSFREMLAGWRRPADAEASLEEAELIAALVFARREPDSYSHVKGVSGRPEARLRERMADESSRVLLGSLLDVNPDRVRRLAGELYEQFSGPNRYTRSALYPAD